MGRIFISYRRADSRLITNRIYDRLSQSFGKKNVFKDVDNIPPGRDFRGVLREATANCSAMLVIIGPDWLNTANDKGQRRLDDPNDFVRLEVETGLQREGVLVIPILIDDTKMPNADDLPDSLRELAYNNAIKVFSDDPHFHHSLAALITHLRNHIKLKSSLSFDWRWIISVILIPILAAIIGGLIQNPSILGSNQSTPVPSSTTSVAPLVGDEVDRSANSTPTVEDTRSAAASQREDISITSTSTLLWSGTTSVSATQQATPDGRCFATVVNPGSRATTLNVVYISPSTQSSQRGTVDLGQTVIIVDQDTDRTGNEWYLLDEDTGLQIGWVQVYYLELDTACDF